MQSRWWRLRGQAVRTELHPLSLYKVSQHWDEAGASQGEKEEKRGVQRLGERKLRESRLRLGGGVRLIMNVVFLPLTRTRKTVRRKKARQEKQHRPVRNN